MGDLLVAEAGRLDKPELFYAEAYSLLLDLRQRLNDRQFSLMIEHVKNGSPFLDAVQRCLHLPDDPEFAKSLEAAWQRHAVEQAQYIRALRGKDAPDSN